MDAEGLRIELAGMDIYLLDQVLKGRFRKGCSILDVGCGAGRNIMWFARNGYDVNGIDVDETHIAGLNEQEIGNFVQGTATELPWPDAKFDAVICNALLHVLANRTELDAAMRESWRVLKPGGIWFTRVATTLGMEGHIEALQDGRYRVGEPGWEVVPLSLDEMLATTKEFGGTLLEPIKAVNVQNQRAMSTWVMEKPALPGA
jgi:ubiquinone/menaquinone biosynthesis C-methylase UbiE